MGRRRFRIACTAGAAVLLAACVEAPSKMPDPARQVPPHDRLLIAPFDVEAIAGQVAAQRGVPMQSAVSLTSVDEVAWTQRFSATSAGGSDGVLYPFGVAPSGGPSGALPALLAKGLAGLYDSRTKAVWIRRRDDRCDSTAHLQRAGS